MGLMLGLGLWRRASRWGGAGESMEVSDRARVEEGRGKGLVTFDGVPACLHDRTMAEAHFLDRGLSLRHKPAAD